MSLTLAWCSQISDIAVLLTSLFSHTCCWVMTFMCLCHRVVFDYDHIIGYYLRYEKTNRYSAVARTYETFSQCVPPHTLSTSSFSR
ncbi:hypothetical protein QBC38DRAFT_469412 [Podospora fimiseda]|uniref:Uncharacterized protein n=1 Tax=Podospora fimiseda TaxID=252190 RepID=A0AAN7H6K8_9PEZI|nr:hypothetical protein QBC38DRAFT_469412 [Podospora fimiseda]